MTIYKHVFKKKRHRLSRTLFVSAVVHLYSFSTKDQKNKWVWAKNTTITHCRPGQAWYYNTFNKTTRSIPFHTQIVCAKMDVRFSIFCPQCCRTARGLFCCLLCWNDTLQTESSILLIGDVAYDACFSVYFEVQSQDKIIRNLVTSPFKSMYFQIFWQKLLSQNNRSYNRENSTEFTQIDLRNIQFYFSFFVSVVFVW